MLARGQRTEALQNQRFAKNSRLTESADFSRVFDKGKRSPGKGFVVLLCENGRSDGRLGVIVSRKVSRLAIHRNRIKRIIRESFRQEKMRMVGLDVLVIARKEVDDYSNEAIFTVLGQHWQKLNPCKNP